MLIEKRLAEIAERKVEIRGILESDAQVDLDAINEELKQLEAEEKELRRRLEVAKGIEAGTVQSRTVAKVENTEKRTVEDVVSGPEYRRAFLKTLLGQPLSDAEQRTFTLVPPTAGAVLPAQTANMIFDQMVKIAPMLNEIQLLRVAGNLRFAVQDQRDQAQFHQELAPVQPAQDTLATVTLTGFEFIKVIRISATIQTMSIDAFESWITKVLGEDLAVAIDNKIINGGNVTGSIAAARVWSPGVSYIQYAPPATISYQNICDCIALLPSAFDGGAKWLMNKATFYQQIMQVKDGNGNLIAIQSLADGGAWRIMGYPVLIDDNVANGTAYFGNFRQVVGNLSQDIRIERSTESGFLNNAIDFRGTAIFDCDVAQPTAITKIDV